MEMNDKITEANNERFDSAMREALAGYEPTVPHASWNKIAAELHPEATDIVHHSTSTLRWKMAIAATVVLTLGLGSLLLYNNGQTAVTTTPVAHITTPKTTTAPKVLDNPTIENKAVAQNKPASKTVVNPTVVVKTEQPTIQNDAVATKEEPKQLEPVKQSEQKAEVPVEFAPIATENRPTEVGNIPINALKILSSPQSINDEITIIKSNTEQHKKHGKRNDDKTKVILINKKYDKQPDINYQVPARF